MLERYGLEDELEEISPELFETYSKFLDKYNLTRKHFCNLYKTSSKRAFTHARRVIKIVDRIIDDGLYDLNEDEIFCLLVACLFAGSGMDVDEEYYHMDVEEIIADDHLRDDPVAKILQFVYKFHYEFSSSLMENCKPLINELSEEHKDVIRRIVKVRTKKDLDNEELFPKKYTLSNGNEIHFKYFIPIVLFSATIDNYTQLTRFSRDSVLDYDKFTQEYLDSLKLVQYIKVRNHSLDLLVADIPRENLGFKFFLQQLKDDLLTTKEHVDRNPGFSMRQNKINIVDLKNLDTKVF